MSQRQRIVVVWGLVVLIWACCLFLGCLLLTQTVFCSEDEEDEEDPCKLAHFVTKLHRYRSNNNNNRSALSTSLDAYEDIPSIEEVDLKLISDKDIKSLLIWSRNTKFEQCAFENSTWKSSCDSSECEIVTDRGEIEYVDAVLFLSSEMMKSSDLPKRKPPHHLWILHISRPPGPVNLKHFNGLINWTSGYKSDSDIPVPSGEFYEWTEGDIIPDNAIIDKNSFDAKNRSAAWFTSDCARNSSTSWDVVNALQNHISVDIFGPCGDIKCHNEQSCSEALLKPHYKFYLAFEDQPCREYITDKFWRTALQNDVIPVVMGPARADYERVTPPGSFIHVNDFTSIADLGRYLAEIDGSYSRFIAYSSWKQKGYVVSRGPELYEDDWFWCDVCAKLQDADVQEQVYDDLEKWWGYEEKCDVGW